MRISFAAILALCMASPALAAWDVARVVEPMTDKTVTIASLQARTGHATLRVQCGSIAGPELMFPAIIPFDPLGISFRFDDGPVVPRFATVSQDRTTAYPWLADPKGALDTLRKAKRLRVSIGPAFLDYDLSGAESALNGCR